MTQLTIHFGHLNAFARFSRAFTEKHRFALISLNKQLFLWAVWKKLPAPPKRFGISDLFNPLAKF